ncbi:MAG: AAA family ATPase [Chloroflexi bacterium]|nr:AAA family ATPase [Chloroflexota bacterium]MBU1746863.1 AAA family ATPase [Chloroflexota bacterium]MBU1878472.1 AAA family ATPase [Chloroflexota bacterium]
MFKIAITGKGGVGKTTLASLLSHLYAQEGYTVIAIDADPDANLASALGFTPEEAEQITPIAEMDELIEERTGAKPGSFGGMFRMNPRVDDIPERFAATHDNIHLLIMGTVRKGGSGCVCPENVLLKTLVTHLLLRPKEVIILDMEAGIEHLGRATAQAVDALIVVVEPGKRSFQTAGVIEGLAKDIGIPHVYVVGSKVRNESDRALIANGVGDLTVLGYLSYNPAIIDSDIRGAGVFEAGGQVVEEARIIQAALDERIGKKT